MKPDEVIKKFETGLLYFLVLLLPLFTLSSFANAFDTPKLVLVVSSLLLLVSLKAIRSLITNKISFSTSKFDIPVFLMALVYVVSAIIESPNKMDAFFLPGTATVVVSAAVLYFLINQLSNSEKNGLKNIIFLSAVIYSVVTLFATAGVFTSIPQLPEYAQTRYFSTLGSSLAGLLFLVAISPLGVPQLLEKKDLAKRALYGVGMALIVFAALISLFNILPGQPNSPKIPSFSTSWSVAIDAIKLNPLLGMGPGNYLSAFTRFIPIEYNQSDIWSVRYTTGSSYILTMFTEVGIAGLAAFSILLFTIYRSLKGKIKNTRVASLLLLTTMLIVVPSSLTLMTFFYILIALNSESDKSKFDLFNFENKESSTRLPVLIAIVPVLAIVVAIGFYAQRIIAADLTYKQALVYTRNNEGGKSYDTLRRAISTNPIVDRYRISYAQINLAIANSLAAKEDLSDSDRETIAQLIQQSIREGKNAVALNPTKASNWEVLASIYRSVAPLAEGADAFAAQTYRQAIALDPLNPNLRISLGGIFYAAGQYENAIDTFELAASVKPDHANSFFNLAAAYREAGRVDDAISAMSRVLSLVERDSQDFEVATKALEELQQRKTNAEIENSDNLVGPDVEETDVEPVIELDEEQAPPEAPALDEEEAEATSTPSPTPTPLP